jgi:hypothetical protein
LSISLLAGLPAQAKPRFVASDVPGPGSELLICDLDGDGLKDLVLKDEFALSIFYQQPNGVFPRQPQQSYRLEARPSLLWTAKLGGPAESLLVMTSDGVSELRFINRTSPPALRQIITQPTLIPRTAPQTNAACVPMSAKTSGDWPLLLVPAADGLQVWQHRDDWRQAQNIPHAMSAHLWPSIGNPGYTRSLELDLSVGDVNGDGLDDLMVRRGQNGRTNLYTLYLQQSNGLFALEPALTYADKVEPFSWLCWRDLNRDGKVDLIKSVWLNEPSFVPGVPAGKVLVSIYMADEHGRIPAQPQQVLRKNDWLPALPVVDVDGDGFPDLVLGSGAMDSREGVRKQVTAQQLDFSFRIYCYRPGIGYPKEADCQRSVMIRLAHTEFPLDWSLPQNFQRCVKVLGDFNGDGKADLLVRDHADAISVYFFVSRQKGFSQESDLQFSCPELQDEWQITDLNNDGVSDLIVKLGKKPGLRVFTSQR